VPGRGNPGLILAVLGAVLAVASFGLVPWLGVVVPACLGLVAVLALGGAGTWIQLERARGAHPDVAVDGVRAVLRVLIAFAFVTPFWSLFDQKASTWILQANDMTKPDWFEPAQMQALNPALVMILIPFNNLVLFPLLRRRGVALTSLRKMVAGVAFSGVAWVAVGLIQVAMDGGTAMSILWQILPYALLTFGELLVSATGLEFAYSQAPAAMKGVIMSFWNLAVTLGNVWVLLANLGIRNEAVLGSIAGTGMSVTAFLMFFFAGFAFLAALGFGLYARTYREVDHYRAAS
jgi:POT family proton-dependent oligopeptide transporter